MKQGLDIVVLGLSITSSWGNGHATTFRALIGALHARGHRVLFLERDVPWYAANRDLPEPPYCRTALYRDRDELARRWGEAVRRADLVIVGSYVPEGVAVGCWVLETAGGVRAFYDIDTPVTLAKLAAGDHEYLDPELLRSYDLYLSFTGGPTLERIERELGSPMARPLHCAADPVLYRPMALPCHWQLGYLGTYSTDRQPVLERLLIEPARRRPSWRCVVAGPQYPAEIAWPRNVDRMDHVAPAEHAVFYAGVRYSINVTRRDMVRAGWSPSVRLFEVAACGGTIVSDRWDGIADFFVPDEEILLAGDADEVLAILDGVDDERRRRIGAAARRRVLAEHTPIHRAAELEDHFRDAQLARDPAAS